MKEKRVMSQKDISVTVVRGRMARFNTMIANTVRFTGAQEEGSLLTSDSTGNMRPSNMLKNVNGTDPSNNLIARGLWSAAGVVPVVTYNAETPAVGEVLTMITGTTAGWRAPGEQTYSYTPVSASSYSVQAVDQNVAVTASGATTIQLPPISSTPRQIRVIDVGGNSSVNNITVLPDLGEGDTINGEDEVLINSDYAALTFISNLTSGWNIV